MQPSKVHVFFFLNTSKKKKKEIIRIFILKTSNIRTKYTSTLDKKKKKINRHVVGFLGSN